MDREIARLMLFDALKQAFGHPASALLAHRPVPGLDDDRRLRREVARPVAVRPRPLHVVGGARLRTHAEDRVVAIADAEFARELHERRLRLLSAGPGHVVGDDQQRVGQETAVQLQVETRDAVGLLLAELRGTARVALPVHAETADVDERHVGVAVVPVGERLEERRILLQEHGIVVDGLPTLREVLARAVVRVAEPDALRAGGAHVVGTGVGRMVAADDAEGDLLALRDPVLRHAVDHVPAELALLRLQLAPEESEVDS